MLKHTVSNILVFHKHCQHLYLALIPQCIFSPLWAKQPHATLQSLGSRDPTHTHILSRVSELKFIQFHSSFFHLVELPISHLNYNKGKARYILILRLPDILSAYNRTNGNQHHQTLYYSDDLFSFSVTK